MTIRRIAQAWAAPRQVGYPNGCSALDVRALQPCKAELEGRRCLQCRREGSVPWPAKWNGPGWNYAGGSIQAVRLKAGPTPWLTIVFLGDLRVDGRFPPIASRSKSRALQLALAQARYLEPRAPIVEWCDAFKVGNIIVAVCEPGS
jgi:hypothetical protein